ncbi:MAG: 2-oxoacid:acceptor oxidoreductase family protein [Candidatus Aenigmatarchaeota archaeon]
MPALFKGVVEIIIYGRGGQGAKTAGELIAEAALIEGKFAQAFPEYGPERRGAPTRAFVRIYDRELRSHEPILDPDYIIVLDKSLTELIENKGAKAIINAKEAKNEFGETYLVDASAISYEVLGKNVPNTVLAGAFARVSQAVRVDSVLKVKEEVFAKKYGKGPVAEKNLELVRRGFDGVKKI